MCARFSLAVPTADLQSLLEVPIPEDVPPRANVAPTLDVPAAALDHGRREFKMLRWGLIPVWAESSAIGQRLINARAEGAFEKPAFRDAVKSRRCIIPANGFYEWREQSVQSGLDLGIEPPAKAKGTYKQPYLFTLASGAPFVFAGLWDRWKNPQGEWLHTFTILTTEPNALLEEFHDRMPCMLDHDAAQVWMNPTLQSPDQLMPVLQAMPPEALAVVPADPRLNNPRYEPFAL